MVLLCVQLIGVNLSFDWAILLSLSLHIFEHLRAVLLRIGGRFLEVIHEILIDHRVVIPGFVEEMLVTPRIGVIGVR